MSLYEEPEKPSDALDYVRKQLGSIVGVDIDGLRKENEQLSTKVKELTTQVAELNKKLEGSSGASQSSATNEAAPAPAPTEEKK